MHRKVGQFPETVAVSGCTNPLTQKLELQAARGFGIRMRATAQRLARFKFLFNHQASEFKHSLFEF